jgi:acyl-CoA synthetase (AMP-forming)/AMP-acid ligase II
VVLVADTIPSLLADAATRFADRPAVIDGETRLTYAELLDSARSFGAALIDRGVRAGDRVGIWMPNTAAWIVAALGIFEAGAVLVPVNTRFKGAEAGDILSRSRAKVLVTVTDFLDTDYVALLEDGDVSLPELETIVVASGPVPTAGSTKCVGWTEFLIGANSATRAELDRRVASVRRDDPADILFTSGTTGRPKGVVQTHGRTLQVATDWVAMTRLTEGDRYLMVNPYFHMFGLKAGILACISAGATMLPEAVLDVDRVLLRVAAEKITVLPGTPTLHQTILDHPGRGDHDLSSLRVTTIGGADIPVELIRRIHEDLPFSVVVAGYGLTEAGTAFSTGPGDDFETIATTVGRPRTGFELRIVDDKGHDVPAGEAGEILLRGPSVMLGYLDDPNATTEALSVEGWLSTGDLGVLTESGCLRIVGRSKDMFIVGGFNAYPAEIENILLQHPDIQQVAVLGVPDTRMGEVGMAFVVLEPGATATGDDIVEWSRREMANYKAPRRVEILDALPLNATGKVMKDELRAQVPEVGPVQASSPNA